MTVRDGLAAFLDIVIKALFGLVVAFIGGLILFFCWKYILLSLLAFFVLFLAWAVGDVLIEKLLSKIY